MVGSVWLFGFDEEGPDSARLGAWMLAEHRGRGLMTASVRLFSEWAFAHLTISTIHLHIDPHNPASRRVIEKLGAAPNGRGTRVAHGRVKQLDRHLLTGSETEQRPGR